MSRPTSCARTHREGRPAPTPRIAMFGLLLMLTPGAALLAGEEGQKPPEKKPPQPPAAGRKASMQKDAPARPAAAPLRFTDEDLEKYHKPRTGDQEGPVEEEPDAGVDSTPSLPPAAAPAPGPPPRAAAGTPPAKGRAAPVPARPRAAKPPAEDPLKRWKDREGLEAFRTAQIEDLRGRIASLQERLGYLERKRLAIVDPLRIMPPPRTPEEAAENARQGPRDLLEAVETEIETVTADLDQAKKDLIAAETRFAQESAAP